MILYLDSSALVKVYVREVGSDTVRRALASSAQAATAVVAIPEFHAAVARRVRESMLSERQAAAARSDFEADVTHYLVPDVDRALAHRAAELATVRGLRGFDAVHLAAALKLAEDLALPDVVFASADRQLRREAANEGLTVLEPDQ